MVGLYPGAIYPGLYDWLLEIPVEPGIPPGTCVTSDVRVDQSVTAEVECRESVESCGVEVWQSPVPQPQEPVLAMGCEIDVRQAVECEIVCRCLTTSEGVEVSYLEDDVETEAPKVCAEVTVTYLTPPSAIGCTPPPVTSSITVRTLVTSDLVLCTCKE